MARTSPGRWVVGVGWTAGPPPRSQVGNEVTFKAFEWRAVGCKPSAFRWCGRRKPKAAVGLAVAGRWVGLALGAGRWVGGRVTPGVALSQGVGSFSRRRFRAALAGPPLFGLFDLFDLAAAAPIGEVLGQPSRRRPCKTRPGPNGDLITPIHEDYREAEEFFFGVGCPDFGVGCSGSGVGWHGPPVGRWVVGRWVPLVKALGGVG